MKLFGKPFSLVALVAVLFLSTAQSSLAQQGAAPARAVFSSTPLSSSTYTVINAKLLRSISGIMISNNSSVALQVGTESSGATANTETQRLIVPPGVNGGQNPMVFYPIQVSAGYRISIKGYSGTSVGEADFNFIYN